MIHKHYLCALRQGICVPKPQLYSLENKKVIADFIVYIHWPRPHAFGGHFEKIQKLPSKLGGHVIGHEVS